MYRATLKKHLVSEWLSSKRQQISVGKDVEKGEPSCTVAENVN